MKKIAASILSADFLNLKLDIEKVTEAGTDMLHIDVMDGKFVPNISIGDKIVKEIDRISTLPLDVHLMISQPEFYIERFCLPRVEFITVHFEASSHIDRTLNFIKAKGKKAGLAINPSTSLYAIDEILNIADLVLIMSVNPGFGGQKFIDYSLNKIEKLFSLRTLKKLNFLIEIDGGVNLENLEKIAKAGADLIVAGNSIFKSENYKNTISEMKRILT